jgi:hypothetical protein
VDLRHTQRPRCGSIPAFVLAAGYAKGFGRAVGALIGALSACLMLLQLAAGLRRVDEASVCDAGRGSSDPTPLRLRPRHPNPHALRNPRPLKLRYRGHDVELQTAAGVPVSMLSFRLPNATPSAVISSSNRIRCRRLRPRRSNFQTTRTSNRLRLGNRSVDPCSASGRCRGVPRTFNRQTFSLLLHAEWSE